MGGGGPSSSSYAATFYLLFTTWRGCFAIVIFFGLAQAYAIRVCMSVAVVDIVKEFNYSSAQQGLILSSFYIGYMIPQLGAGYLAGRFGGFAIVLYGILMPSLLTLLTPWAASSFTGLVALRILTGFTEGVTYPALHSMLAEWAPANERSTILNVCWSGAYFGTATTFPLAGAIAGGTLKIPGSGSGWRAMFYTQGVLGILWSILFFTLCASSPSKHKWISEAEKMLIAAGTTTPTTTDDDSDGENNDKAAATVKGGVPWIALITNRAVWACVAAHFAHNYAFYLMLSEMPTFLKYQLGFNLANAGAVSVLPYLACFAGANIGGGVADIVVSRKLLSMITVRRVWFACGELLPAIALVSAGFISNPNIVVVLLTLSVGISGISQSGYACTPLDVAPHLAGPWMAFQNTIATIPGIIAPLITSALVDTETVDLSSHWQQVFFLSAGISVVGVMWYVFNVSDQIDPTLAWVFPPKSSSSIDNDIEDRSSTDETVSLL